MKSRHCVWRRVRCRMVTTLVIGLLSILSIAAVCAVPVKADIALIGYTNEGVTVHNGTHISMPEAYVNINITRTGSNMHTNLNGEFHLFTNITQNTTLGFIPPKIGSIGSSYRSHLAISVNGTEKEFTMLGWEDLGVDHGFVTDFTQPPGIWMEDADYAVFNMELPADSITIISVISNTSQDLSSLSGVTYEYIIASARTFEGDTHERVHIQLIEETSFLSVQFSPNSSLTLTEEGTKTDAVWDFYVSEFTDYGVRMNAMVQRYNGYYPRIYQIILATGIIAVIIAAVLMYRRMRVS